MEGSGAGYNNAYNWCTHGRSVLKPSELKAGSRVFKKNKRKNSHAERIQRKSQSFPDRRVNFKQEGKKNEFQRIHGEDVVPRKQQDKRVPTDTVEFQRKTFFDKKKNL